MVRHLNPRHPNVRVPGYFYLRIKLYYSVDLNTGLVWYSNGQTQSDNQMVCYANGDLNTILFQYQNCDLNTRQFVHYKVYYSDVSIIQMFVVKIPTVLLIQTITNFCTSIFLLLQSTTTPVKYSFTVEQKSRDKYYFYCYVLESSFICNQTRNSTRGLL